MKVYRAIEFSKLIWMISDDASLSWNTAHRNHISGDRLVPNWWMTDVLSPFKHEMISDVVFNGQDKFFEKSLEFNAMQGGRFNPSRSFGVLYTSSDPLMASLEVLYHQFISAYPLYKRMSSNRDQFTSSFNMNIPQHLEVLIVAFEIEIADEYCQREVNCEIEHIKADC
ncbi:RES family NAD+ phosphorylase, partial [Flavihumibacter solisilvae]